MIGMNRVILISNTRFSMAKISRIIFITSIVFLTSFISKAQVNAVTFGRNRVQYKNFKWKYYQTQNFNTYFNQDGQELAKFVAQAAEDELPGIEKFTEYNLVEKMNIIVYNNYGDLQQSNIGMDANWQNTNGLAKIVNNKMVVYFNGDHENLRQQIREGIAKVLTDNLLSGGDLGDRESNSNLLDLPQWFTDGYIAFVGENWSVALDDQLKKRNTQRQLYRLLFIRL